MIEKIFKNHKTAVLFFIVSICAAFFFHGACFGSDVGGYNPDEFKLTWFPQKYSANFIESFFPANKEILSMDVWGFFYLWGLISFIETNIPEGLDGPRYAILVRDLKNDIDILKKDMYFLVEEVWGVRKIDRDVMIVQLFNIYAKLRSIITAVQKVRTNLIKPAYFLFYNSLDHKAVMNGTFDFSATLNYLSVDSIWSMWRSKKDVYAEIETAKSVGVNTVKVGVYLDYWVYKNSARVNEIREVLGYLKKQGFKLYINFMGVRGWYAEDYTFKQKSGRTTGYVNFLTWRYHCEQAIASIISEFQPDYATVIKEPLIDFQEQLNETVPVELWLDCFTTIALEASKNSPSTIVVIENGLSTPADFELFKKFQEIKPKNVAFGALIYSLKDIFSYNQYDKMCKIRKKTIVAEFWDSTALYIDEYAEDFIYLVYRWALYKKMQLINLSYITNLHTYNFDPTPAFYVYKNIITRTFMEGFCKKGIKSKPDGLTGTLYESYGEYQIKYQFWRDSILRERVD